MGVVHENFWAWRFKILAVAVVLSLMLISIVKRFILPLFAGVVLVVAVALPASAYTWNDVIIAWAAHQSPQGCTSFVTKYTQSGQTGFQLWDRCNASTVLSYKKVTHSGGQLFTNYWSPPYNCVGDWSGNPWNYYTTYDGGVDYETSYKCDGSTSAPVNMAGPSRATLQQDCYLGLKNTLGQITNSSDPTLGTNCASLDTQFGNFWPVTDDCQYVNLGVNTPGGWASSTYKSLVPDDGSNFPCNQCIPRGTAPFGHASHNTPQSGDTQGRFQCYWKDITGDPGKPADSYAPPANGGGSAGNDGGLRDGVTQTTQTVSDGNGNTETSTTTTTTTNNPDGTTSSSTTEKITYCHDVNQDGISDITGRKCAESTTSTSTANPSAAPASHSPYSNGNLPTVGNFGDLFTQFANQMKTTPLFSTFTLSGLSPSGTGVSTYAINAGSYGSHNIDLADYATSLNIVKGIVLLLGSYLAVRIVVLKR